MPINMQFSFLDSHYGSRRTLFTGCIGQIAACCLCIATTGDLNFIWYAALSTIIVFGRLVDMYFYDRATVNRQAPATPEFLKHWDMRYSIGVYVSAGALGTMAGYSLFFYPISLAAVITVGLACGSLISVVGRNFGKIRNINLLTMACGMPMCLALLTRGFFIGTDDIGSLPEVAPFLEDQLDPRILLAATAILLAPLMQIARELALNVRTLLHHAFTSTAALNYSKQIVHIALDNMPSGLIMLDENNRIQLMNLKVERFMGMSSERLAGKNLLSVIRGGAASGRYSETQARRHAEQFRKLIQALDHDETPSDLFFFRDDEVIEVKAFRTVRSVLEAVSIDDSKPKPFLNEETRGIVFILEDVSERISAKTKIEHMGRYDGLSSLPNRNHFTDLITDAVARMGRDTQIALAMFDVDGFKKINDTLGHSAGDQVIIHVANKMKKISDPRVLLCRTGGDEFVVAFPGLTNDDDISQIFDSVFNSVCTNYVIQGRSLSVKVSGGVTCMGKEDFVLDEALKQADFALYETKVETKSGKPRQWQMFSAAMAETRQKSDQTRDDLRQAIKDEAFHIVYQAMRSPDAGKIVCAEALARWFHPTRGLVSPVEFIKTAEEIGLVSDITRIVLNKACREAMTWPDSVAVSVNLSAMDLTRPDILHVISKALETSGLPADRLQVEVTETVFVSDMEQARDILGSLRDLGVRIALDDFGTGYSSLSYLADLPLDKVKIDRSFVKHIGQDNKADNIFGATVQLARVAGYGVVVEGVERQEQLDSINAIARVDLVQGWLFGQPVSAPAMKSQIASTNGIRDGKVIDINASRHTLITR
ncbi:EAL domain-containing protein [Agrobacterium rubi]|nr:EAL domain-containing protein [Agrobacterium rubi]NTF23909.1 EAL domain-containing protein [Agrobacterium rubi]